MLIFRFLVGFGPVKSPANQTIRVQSIDISGDFEILVVSFYPISVSYRAKRSQLLRKFNVRRFCPKIEIFGFAMGQTGIWITLLLIPL